MQKKLENWKISFKNKEKYKKENHWCIKDAGHNQINFYFVASLLASGGLYSMREMKESCTPRCAIVDVFFSKQ